MLKLTRAFVLVHPVIQVPNQLVGAPLSTDVTLECYVEASPKSINYWVRHTGKYSTLDRISVRKFNKNITRFNFASSKSLYREAAECLYVMKIAIFLVITPCIPYRFGGTYHLYLQGRKSAE
jgi:hypothetical protein